MTEKNLMLGLYQRMLSGPAKSGVTNDYGMMQTVFQQVDDILNEKESNMKFNENVIENPYGFNEYIDPDMITKMKTLFDNYCDVYDKQNNNNPSKDDEKKERKLNVKHLKDILQLFGFYLSDAEIDKLQHTVKNVYSMQLTFDTLFQILIKEIDASKDDDIIKQAFKECDINNLNQLSINDIKQMLHDLNVDKHSEGQIQHLMHFVNEDKNRKFLSLQDFRKLMNMDLKLFERAEFEYKTVDTNSYDLQAPKQPTIKRTTTPYRFTKARTINKNGTVHRNYKSHNMVRSSDFKQKSKKKQRSRPFTAINSKRSRHHSKKLNDGLIITTPKLHKLTSM